MKYILAIDQSTAATKAMIFDENAELTGRADKAHRQLVDGRGWVEHNPAEIYDNLLYAVEKVIADTGIEKAQIVGAGISNQRETAIVWDKTTGEPLHNAIVWQCARGKDICERIEANGGSGLVKEVTGINLSPYFSAAKIAWVLENVPTEGKDICCSTMDSWLVYKLTGAVKTDYSNASRSQLFNINTLKWDSEVCALFGIPLESLAEVVDSNSLFGYSDFGGIFQHPIPVHGVLGDSHAALLGQGCFKAGMIKTTYGTGSSVMMNIGDRPINSDSIVTSLAWGLDGEVNYVLEGNLNYTGAVIKWLIDDVQLLSCSKESEEWAQKANPNSGLYLVPAFSGLGAPYWDDSAKAALLGMGRGAGKAEIVRAAVECIAYQITDILRLMIKESGFAIKSVKVDGGPTGNAFLMQFQADIANVEIMTAAIEELSGFGAALAAGMALGVYNKESVSGRSKAYCPNMGEEERESRYKGWQKAVHTILAQKWNESADYI